MAAVRMALSGALKLWVFSSIGTALLTLACAAAWRHELQERAEDPHYTIRALVQTGPEVEAVPTGYLAELLGLSKDRPVNLYQVSTTHLEERLLSSPVLREARVSRRLPSTLEIQYQARTPIAAVIDLEQGWLDEEGVLFPGQPFQRPRQLVQVYLGLHRKLKPPYTSKLWGSSIPKEQITLLEEFLQHPAWQNFTLQMVDLGRLQDADYGKREWVLRGKPAGWNHVWWVRLPSRNWQTALAYLPRLVEAIRESDHSVLVDLRMDQMALYQELDQNGHARLMDAHAG